MSLAQALLIPSKRATSPSPIDETFQEYIANSSGVWVHYPLDDDLESVVGGPTLSFGAAMPNFVSGALNQAAALPDVASAVLRLDISPPYPFPGSEGSLSFMLNVGDITLLASRVLSFVSTSYPESSIYIGIESYPASGNALRFQIIAPSTNLTETIVWPHVNQWGMIGVSWSLSAGVMTIYFDGEQVGEIEFTPSSVSSPNGGMIVAVIPGRTSRQTHYPQAMDEYAYWSTAKNATHFATLYQKWQEAIGG